MTEEEKSLVERLKNMTLVRFRVLEGFRSGTLKHPGMYIG